MESMQDRVRWFLNMDSLRGVATALRLHVSELLLVGGWENVATDERLPCFEEYLRKQYRIKVCGQIADLIRSAQQGKDRDRVVKTILSINLAARQLADLLAETEKLEGEMK